MTSFSSFFLLLVLILLLETRTKEKMFAICRRCLSEVDKTGIIGKLAFNAGLIRLSECRKWAVRYGS